MADQNECGGTLQQVPKVDVADQIASGDIQPPERRRGQRVRCECEKAAIRDEPIGYLELAKIIFGVGNRRTLRLVDKILCENMRDDLQAGRPFAAVAVQRVGDNKPGIGFFECAWKLGRFDRVVDAADFVTQEWNDYRRSLGVGCDDHAADVLPVTRVISGAQTGAHLTCV